MFIYLGFSEFGSLRHFFHFVFCRFIWKSNMSKSAVDVPPRGGFSFDLCRRNAMLSEKGVKLPTYRKTGTTIVGLVFQVLLLINCCFILF